MRPVRTPYDSYPYLLLASGAVPGTESSAVPDLPTL
eukprot:SAG11_NODE_12662_length_691_cov_2.927365_1_plen_35_part_01